MRAGRITVSTRAFEMVDVPTPDAAAGQVRIKVGAAGVCLSDVHFLEGILSPGYLNGDCVTLGHEVSGTIDMAGSNIDINNNDITILGQTAPGDGICIKGGMVTVNASNVICRYIRFRPGAGSPAGSDAVSVSVSARDQGRQAVRVTVWPPRGT